MLTLLIVLLGHFSTTALCMQPSFYSPHAIEAEMEFDHQVQFSLEKDDTQSVEEKALAVIQDQIYYLVGNMRSLQTTPRGDEKISSIQITAPSATLPYFRATYHYSGHILLGLASPIEKTGLILPIRPQTFYKESTLVLGDKETYPCTDSHYSDEESYWYFWNPNRAGCKLQEGVHFLRFFPLLTHLENTQETYPDYSRLADKTGTIDIWYFAGMDDADKKADPFHTDDANAEFFRMTRAQIIARGFKSRLWTAQEVKEIVGPQDPSELSYVEEFSFIGSHANIRVTAFYGRTGIYEESAPFHQLYRKAVEQGSVIIYNGHSGLGEYLDLTDIENKENFKFSFPEDRFQLFMLYGCSSYSYYLDQYFIRKVSRADPLGHHNLNIISTGAAVGSDTFPEATLSLLEILKKWAESGTRTSYQSWMNTFGRTQNLSVSGDEANPK